MAVREGFVRLNAVANHSRVRPPKYAGTAEALPDLLRAVRGLVDDVEMSNAGQSSVVPEKGKKRGIAIQGSQKSADGDDGTLLLTIPFISLILTTA
jgi:hypothetical protein